MGTSIELNRMNPGSETVERATDRFPSPITSRRHIPQANNVPVQKLSHDIRTQLYIIIGFAELMLDEIPGKINDEQRRNLNDVLASGKRLFELLNGIINRP
jgi:signal transduction histidine kinase